MKSPQMIREQLPANGTDPISRVQDPFGRRIGLRGLRDSRYLRGVSRAEDTAIESSAFSIASFVAMAFDDVEISSNGYMMLHNPYAQAEGDDEDFAKQSAATRTTQVINGDGVRNTQRKIRG
jgi:hypothetical protein